MRKWLLAATGAFVSIAGVLTIISGDRSAHAKAHDNPQGNVTVEAVITAVQVGDNPDDTDLDLFLRPLAPGEASAFPSTIDKPHDFLDSFWDPGSDEIETWLEGSTTWSFVSAFLPLPVPVPAVPRGFSDGVKGALEETRKRGWSHACKVCAGGEENTCRPDPDEHYYNHNPCPKLFRCGACLWDVWRANADDGADLDPLANITPKAEVFVGRYAGEDDFNKDFFDMVEGLGVTNVDRDEDSEQTYCREFKWDSKKGDWNQSVNQLCGKHALLTGTITYDGAHDERLEIHPLSSIVIAHKPNHYRVGAFIDGSSTSVGGSIGGNILTGGQYWGFDYREDFGRRYMPDTVQFSLAKLMGRQPPTGNGVFWTPECSVHPRSGHNVLSVDRVPVQSGLCDGRSVHMDFSKPTGAAWTAALLTGWQKRKAELKIVSATLKTPGGILAYNPRDALDAKGGYLASSAGGAAPDPRKTTCDFRKRVVDKKSKRGKKDRLKRWYEFEIQTEASVEKADPEKVSWEWTRNKPLSNAIGINPNTIKSPVGKNKFSVWLPVHAMGKYSGQLEGDLVLSDAIAGHENNLTVDVTINRVRQIDDEDGWGDDDFYARVTIDGHKAASGYRDDTRDVSPNWKFHSSVGQHKVPITIVMMDDDDGLNFDDDVVDIHPSGGKRALHIVYDTQTGTVSGDATGQKGQQIHVRGGGNSDRAEVWFTVTHQGRDFAPARPATVASESTALRAPRPMVRLKTTSANVGAGPVFTASLKAKASRFCGDEGALKYIWTKNGTRMSGLTGPGPFEVSLKPGAQELYEVIVHDPWGVEVATDAIVVGAPALEVTVTPSCAVRTTTVTGGLKGLPGGKNHDPMARELCGAVKLTATAIDEGGVGAKWTGTVPASLTYEWSDLQYQEDEAHAKWEPIPTAWLKDASTAVLTIAGPPQLRYLSFAGTLTVTDPKTGRKDIASFKTTNDVTTVQALESIVENLWRAARPGKLLPNPEEKLARIDDPLERSAHALLRRLKNAKSSDEATVTKLRTSVNAFRRYVVWSISKASFGHPKQPHFTKNTTRFRHEPLQEKAKDEAHQRLAHDDALLRALRVRGKR
jgi:hypothetical protein